jgi:hydrogenase-4 component B
MSRLGGLWRAMPWTASLFTVGAVSASALPPLNGFVSEWLVYLGLFDAAAVHHKAGLATLPAAMALGITGALALAAFVKAAALVFVGAPRTRAARHAHECGWWMRGPMLALAIGCAFLALAPALLWPLLARVAASWHPAWVAAAAPSALTLLGGLQAVLALALVAAGAVLWRAVRRRGSSRGPTWDCGYVAPSPRMQYTGGSFDAIVSSWTRLALRPRRRLRRPRGVFPRQADHVALMPDVVLENVVQPAGRLVLRASAFVRRLQHGRLQDYILYLVAGIAAITAIVVFEGKPWN